MAEASPLPTENSARPARRGRGATPVIGLTGGIGGGKSAVAALLAERGAVVIDADVAGHEALQRPDVRERLVERFGSRILADETDGPRIDRRALGRIVFSDPSALRDLEAIVHPVMVERFQAEIAAARARPDVSLVVIDAAILLEAGWNALCDLIVFVDAPRAARLERVGSRGWSDAEFQAREAAQWSPETKANRADYVLPNAGGLDELGVAVDRFLDWLSDRDSSARVGRETSGSTAVGEEPRHRSPSAEPSPL